MFGSISRLFKSAGLKKNKEGQSPFAAPPIPEETATTIPPIEQPVAMPSVDEESHENFSSSDVITLPLPAIMKQIPKELLGIDASTGAAKCKFCLPKEVAAKQLESGSVKVTFGTIRKAVPSGIFINTSGNDDQEIALPLHLIISQVDSELYQRRQAQQIKEVPDSIQDLFGPKGQGLAEVRILDKEELRKNKSSPGATEFRVANKKPQFAPPVPRPAKTPPIAESQQNSPFPVDHPISAEPSVEDPPAVISGSSLMKALGETAASPKNEATTSSAECPAADSSTQPEPKPIPVPANIPLPSPISTSASNPVSHLTVPLALLTRAWPEPILEEIKANQLGELNCEFPVQEVKSGLQLGKISFRWSQVRSWLNPSPESSESSPHGELELIIPLDVVAPQFLKAVVLPSRQFCSSPSGIPDVFASQQNRPEEPESAEKVSLPPPASATLPKQKPISRAKVEPKVLPKSPASITGPEPSLPLNAAATSQSTNPFLKLDLASVSATWPPEIQQEIQSFGLSGAHLAIASDYLEKGLRAGKIELTWSQVLSWVADGPETTGESSHGESTLTLPLDIIAPMYFQLRKSTATKKFNVPKDIPDVFSAKGEKLTPPQTESTVTPSARGHANLAAPAMVDVKPKTEKKRPANIAELFGEPKKKSWTPNEIVQRATQLQGVAGALIALQDGLLVAGCLPPGWKTETFAAFIPQMFGRMTQYTKELSLGSLQSLTLIVEKGPVQVFSAGPIYFAVVGKKETPLPSEDLAIIANELSRHTK